MKIWERDRAGGLGQEPDHGHGPFGGGCGGGCLGTAPVGGLSRRAALRLGGAGLAAAGLSGCISTNRATGETQLTGFSSLDDDKRIGRENHPKLLEAFGGEYENPRLQRYVERIGGVLAEYAEYQEFTYRFFIVNSPIINAFALPGGYCYVSRGLVALASNEAELAGVVAHEIGHVTARHTAQRMAQAQMAQGLLLGATILTGQRAVGQLGSAVAGAILRSFSREQEIQADSLGIRYMSQAGYDPEAMVQFLDTMRDHSQVQAEKQGRPADSVDETNIMATHPRTIERVRAAEKLTAEYSRPGLVVNRDRYLDRIDGMLYGDDPEQGIVDGRAFVHPKLRFAFTVPEGFIINNGTSEVVAQKPNVKAAIVFDGAQAYNRDILDYLVQEWAEGIQLSDVGRIDINGIPAATGATRINGSDYRVVAIKADKDRVWRLRFISDPSVTASLETPFRETTYSFRRLSKAEASRIQPLRMIVVPIQPGDTVASLASGYPEGNFNQAAFRVHNDLKPGDALPRSGRVKVVVGGARRTS